MTTIRINVSEERLDTLSVDDMIAVEDVGEGKVSTKALKSIISKFIADEKGEYIAEDEAAKIVGKIPRKQFIEVVKDFFGKVIDTIANPTTDSN